jgi:hypothetical protein
MQVARQIASCNSSLKKSIYNKNSSSHFPIATYVHHGNDGNVVIATESGSYDGISMATISHTSTAIPTEQQLAALSQFTSNMQSHHVTDHDQPTLYVLEDPSEAHHDGDHQHVGLFLFTTTVSMYHAFN